MLNRKILAMAGVGAMMIGLMACGSKAESNIAESVTPEPTAEATPTPEPTEEPAESHDFDLSVNEYKTESDTADCDSGTDIEELDTLYDWLYNNGVTRKSVQNDRDSGCKNPYLDGYLEYLDGLAEKTAGTVASSQPENAEMTGETVTISGIEFKMDSTGGAYDNYGDYWTKDELADFEVKQKELAELDKANRANENVLDETNTEPATQEEIEDFIKNDLHGTMK